ESTWKHAYCGSRVAGRLLSQEFFFARRRRHTRLQGDWSSDVCSSDPFFTTMPMSRMMPIRAITLRSSRAASRASSAPTPAEGREIGRASCRDRVWVYAGADAAETERPAPHGVQASKRAVHSVLRPLHA